MMALQLDPSIKDDLKTQFITREGTYRLMTLSEYSRPNRVGYPNTQSSPQVRVSIVSLPNIQSFTSGNQCLAKSGVSGTPTIESRPGVSVANDQNGLAGTMAGGDRICFNFGKELYVYAFRGVKKGSELTKPIDKKLYKGTNPSCHDFNLANATIDGASLLVGFTTGQIQLVQPGRREPGKLYNEERLIDKTKVTCLKWLPGSPNLFLASHASGCLYLYNEELPCTPTTPNYQPFKMGDGYTVLTCKTKSTRNPLYKWAFGAENCSVNEFSFSPCGSNLAVVSQDGFLRVFHYDTMDLIGIARSYFGGFLCVCWSPDGKYIVVGGEDDLVTVWSLHERRVVARGQGHRSWVSVVAFDPYTTSYSSWDCPDFSDDENPVGEFRLSSNETSKEVFTCDKHISSRRPNSESIRESVGQDKLAISYRLGSVSQDTQLCLWDITEDVLRHPLTLRPRVNSNNGSCNQANGEVVTDVKIINPIVTTSSSNPTKEETSCNISSKNSINSSSSKFSTANCTISLSNDSGEGYSFVNETTNNKNAKKNALIFQNNNSNKQSNCGSIGNSFNKSETCQQSLTESNNKSSSGSSKSSDSSGLSAFNSLTQRLSSLSFGNDKKSAEHRSHSRQTNHKKALSLSKSSGNYHTLSIHSNNGAFNTESNSRMNSLKNPKTSQTSPISSYDPIKLIGTPACPRFDECPLLEPLVCKKIAHERLTALIFREDCFLTACQDGFIYTWARPGYSSVPQHMSTSPSAPPGGTVV